MSTVLIGEVAFEHLFYCAYDVETIINLVGTSPKVSCNNLHIKASFAVTGLCYD